MAFVVSVLSKVVGVRLEALDRRRMGFETRPSGLKWEDVELGLTIPSGGLVAVGIVVVVVTVTASEI